MAASIKLLIGFILTIFMHRAFGNDHHPRLYITQKRLQEIRTAIEEPESHHYEAFHALKEKVDRNNFRLFEASESNWNYARSYLAQSAAFLYQVTKNPKYASQAFQTIKNIINDPGPSKRMPYSNYGLSRSTVSVGIAMAYDWCYNAWEQNQKEYVHAILEKSLDSWKNYHHANLETNHQGSNWVAVCKGGELITMLAASEETERKPRFNKLKNDLKKHMETAYGPTGFTQEGMGYAEYAGIFLLPAVYALQSIDDHSLDQVFFQKNWWKWNMFAGSFITTDRGTKAVLQSGVGGNSENGEGWNSLLLNSVPENKLPYYKYFYDRSTGTLAEVPPHEKYDPQRVGRVWALLYYPENLKSKDPSGKKAFRGLHDPHGGTYYFRNRWRDENDIQISIMADLTHHSHAWDQPEALQVVMYGLGNQFIFGPGKDREHALYSNLMVDGKSYKDQDHTGGHEFFTANKDGGGYVIVNGGSKYQNLGVDKVKRHLLTDFSVDSGHALIGIRDEINASTHHDYTFNLHLGDAQQVKPVEVRAGTAGKPAIFTIQGKQNAYLKGWVLTPSIPVIKTSQFFTGDQPDIANWHQSLQITTEGVSSTIWVIMLAGKGAPPSGKLKETKKGKTFKIGKTEIFFDNEKNRMVTKP